MSSYKVHDPEREDGFTLIELLVVVIIIGILAAIAIPTFLNQRQRAWDSAAQSDLRNMATTQESYYTGSGGATGVAVYTNLPADIEGEGFRPSGAVLRSMNVATNAQSYCMVARHTNSGNTFWMTNDPGLTPSGTITAANATPTGTPDNAGLTCPASPTTPSP